MTTPRYLRHCEMSEDEINAEFMRRERRERMDLLAEILFTVGGCVMIGILIAAGMWLWN